MPPLVRRFGTHFRATCDACRTDIEVCGKRLDGEGAERLGIEKLRRAGWHVDGAGTRRERWYCPSCAAKQHL